ncbi:uncharacterized protein LOC117829592 [Xyrichtys novacula]|uniref:Uncharacterized protein LOC117829592 n=1 Tax=Xyrichtys novacula TaxID=13765 RepID=A0AAV1H9A0_XYRNO|nr:uncharacterized protein LOC117829592 [Xyrichtys novacula]
MSCLCLSYRCHESLFGPVLPLYDFITGEEYEAVLVHHFPLFQHDDVHTAGDTKQRFHDLQKEIKNPQMVQGSPHWCVTYKHRETCGLEGSFVNLPCTYPKNVDIRISGWSKKYNPNKKPKLLKTIPAYASRFESITFGNSDCTLKLTALRKSDASTYYFTYIARNESGQRFTCSGDPGVSLHVFGSAVGVLVETGIKGQNISTSDWQVMEGQRITLTCVPTCTTNQNSTPGYTWYKNKKPLNGRRANSPLLSLDPISNQDTGSYVCSMMGLENLSSSAIKLEVIQRPSNYCTEQTLNYDQAPTNRGIFTISLILIASLCAGFAFGITSTVLIFMQKTKVEKKRRQCVSSVCRRPDQSSDVYMALDISAMSAEYDMLNTVEHCSATETVYENLDLRKLTK